ncbi:MAG TPA: hypothetical protein VMB80_11840 [Candidatus Acidoferrum sp.]|nr:hypothetical protein [Candidatus Acidoferrum sp.]
MKILSSLLLAGGITGLLVACHDNQPSSASGLQTTEVAQWVGKTVRVELHRDALGAVPLPAGAGPAGPTMRPPPSSGN